MSDTIFFTHAQLDERVAQRRPGYREQVLARARQVPGGWEMDAADVEALRRWTWQGAADIERVVIISLARRADRRERLEREIAAMGDAWPFPQPIWLRATDGQLVPQPRGWHGGAGAWGCMQSHRRALEDAMHDGITSLLVLEDDVTFAPDLAARWARFFSRLPADWESLMLGGQCRGESELAAPGVLRVRDCVRTHAYAVRGAYLRDLYAVWCGYVGHCDHAMAGFMGDRRVYAPEQWMAAQADGWSDIAHRSYGTRAWGTGRRDSLHRPTVWWHVGAVAEGWQGIATEQMELLWEVGLERVRASFVGTGEERAWLEGEARRVGVKLEIVASSEDVARAESPAMECIERWAAAHEGVVLYLHTKGASAPGDTGRAQWRQVMQQHLVERWREHFPALVEASVDAVGCNWFAPGDAHFSGNFWMARCEYLRTLRPWSAHHAERGGSRYAAEAWIGTGRSPRVRSLVVRDVEWWAPGYDFTRHLGQPLSIVIPTLGRASLARTLASALPELGEHDEVIVVHEPGATPAVPQDARIRLLADTTPGDPRWGYKARTLGIREARGRWVHVIGDDDVYLPGALTALRRELHGDRPLLCRMRRRHVGDVLWQRRLLVMGNVAGEMFVFPNIPEALGRFGAHYAGDFDFISQTCAAAPEGPRWSELELVEFRA